MQGVTKAEDKKGIPLDKYIEAIIALTSGGTMLLNQISNLAQKQNRGDLDVYELSRLLAHVKDVTSGLKRIEKAAIERGRASEELIGIMEQLSMCMGGTGSVPAAGAGSFRVPGFDTKFH